MISLYIHVPFCDQKCKYCSFNVIPCDNLEQEDKMIDAYVTQLKKDIEDWGNFLGDSETSSEWQGKHELKTLYFGGGTPNKLGKERLMEVIDCVAEYFDLENLGELGIELNPYPEEETLDLIQTIQKTYKKFPRIRRSVGLQTFDSEVLQESGRPYSFPAMVEFLRDLRWVKQMNTVFNFDFIAFGKFNTSKKWNRYLWDERRQKFFQEFVESQFADGFSIYTLELFAGSEWHGDRTKAEELFSEKYGSDDDVYEEFAWLKDVVMKAGYNRYELSNFATAGRRSIHNSVYWDMENYLGLGTSASSFINFKQGTFATDEWKKKFEDKLDADLHDCAGVRLTNTLLMADRLKGKAIDENKSVALDAADYLIEEFFLRLRTDIGIKHIEKFAAVLEDDWEQKISDFQEDWYCSYDEWKLVLTDAGMDVYNMVVTELLKEI